MQFWRSKSANPITHNSESGLSHVLKNLQSHFRTHLQFPGGTLWGGIPGKLSKCLQICHFLLPSLAWPDRFFFFCVWVYRENLFFPTQTQKKKSGLATRDYLLPMIRLMAWQLASMLYFALNWKGPSRLHVGHHCRVIQERGMWKQS